MTAHTRTVTCMAVLALFTTTPAWAYLDPGTGSVLLQIILGGIAGLAVAGKLMWHRVKDMLGFKTTLSEDDAGDDA